MHLISSSSIKISLEFYQERVPIETLHFHLDRKNTNIIFKQKDLASTVFE
jgi:hypothetical protein